MLDVIDRSLESKARGSRVLETVLKGLQSDKLIEGLLEQADLVSNRLGFGDHGLKHAKAVADNSLRIFDILGLEATIVKEGTGTIEDARAAILIGAYLHDIGVSISRDRHETFGLSIARPLIQMLLSRVYQDQIKLAKVSSAVNEIILCHMGNYQPTSLEAKIVMLADAVDIGKGRGRLPFSVQTADRQKFSQMEIDIIVITNGLKKKLRLEAHSTSKIVSEQAKELLLKRIKLSGLDEHIELVCKIKGNPDMHIL